ncbi:MAG: hypothetical protein KDD11_21015 [Acidobacteria bacterium]|nr:hypothetical protein [Acidobacteriota bacterium]
MSDPRNPRPQPPPEAPRITERLARWFGTQDADERLRLEGEITADPAWQREHLSGWLHRLHRPPALKPGRHDLEIPVGFDQRRRMTLRIPRGYTPDRPWPLILALHSGGKDGPSFLPRAEKALGPLVERFVLAAPTNYRQTVIDAPAPFSAEHLLVLRHLRRELHLDSDRIYALGYSLGGYAAWTLAILHTDQLAGAVPMTATFSAPADVEGLWEALAPNFAHLPILHAWGAKDRTPVPGFEGRRRHCGTMSEINQSFSRFLREKGLDVIDHPVAGAAHGGVWPSKGPLQKVLESRRIAYPRRVEHTFRHVHQGHAYWLEAHRWQGDAWGERLQIPQRPGMSREKALASTVLPRLGYLQGRIDGQRLDIRRRHVAELTVWIGEGMIDWRQPVHVSIDNLQAFEDRLHPNLGVCLREVERTGDRDRLRWAGVRVDERGRSGAVEAATAFPRLPGEGRGA